MNEPGCRLCAQLTWDNGGNKTTCERCQEEFNVSVRAALSDLERRIADIETTVGHIIERSTWR